MPDHPKDAAAPAPGGAPAYDSPIKGCLPWIIGVVIAAAVVVAAVLWSGVFRP
jgi:hypothetical protein